MGATAVQINGALMARGPRVIGGIKEGMLDFMRRKGYSTIEDFRGIAIRSMLPMHVFLDTYWETKGKIVPEVDMELCNLCGDCEDCCPWEPCTIDVGVVLIDTEKCEGCVLCVANCPEGALKLKNLDMLYEYYERMQAQKV